MTSEQREAAINAIRDNLYGRSLADATCALDALLEEFVVLHRDDVHIEYGGDDHGNDGTQRWVGPWTTQETP